MTSREEIRRSTMDRMRFAVGLVLTVAAAGVGFADPAGAAPAKKAPEIVVYASDVPRNGLYEMEVWKDAASPGGKMIGLTNHGDELDPPPENDPNVRFKVKVQAGVPYRCWIHMKVGKPKGKSQANMVHVQFTEAVDAAGQPTLKPGTRSFLRLRGPEREGWVWVDRDMADAESAAPLVTFKTGGEVQVRVQAGMEGVGFDQFVLSPARFLDKPPAEAVIKK
jgi:hypothetical protein